ncbi:hypothetical protein FSARC_13471 [Fusarium sarcochroum]|uniref:Lipase 1 n=1 Tax=Fusarium sarcochroum TaxID=1208366 RepID=A0A8H4WTA3_9HYPO|nr:hypothetical protein FSARC_13471 [Fusarium sarcochroum]
MSSLDWLLDLCAVAQASSDTITTNIAPLQDALPPSQDPWYTPPDSFKSRHPGDVIRIRSAPESLKAIVGNSSAAYHILYRTTDSRNEPSWAVTTLFIPSSFCHSESGKAAILSYQLAYNSANVDSSPSFDLSGIMANKEPNLGIKPSTSLIDEMLSFGWIVNTPDHLGPTAAFGASVQGGHATLDALRAVHNLFNLRENPGLTTAIWGYSGGSIATLAAAELQPQYAPELEIAGMALGGLADDITADFDSINKSVIAGSLVAILLGITSQYPEERQYLESRLIPDTKSEFMSVKDIEVTEAVKQFSGKDIYLFFKNGSADLKVPQLQELYNKQARLGYKGVPSMPMFMYKAIQDQFCPTHLTDATVDRLCSAGAEITYERNTVGNHVSEIENGKPRAFRWLRGIFDGSYKSPASKRHVADVTVDVST